jgi:hypothetical protein
MMVIAPTAIASSALLLPLLLLLVIATKPKLPPLGLCDALS